ncbi:MAG TPA: M28 family peptidase [Actinomycetes bacterium]|nr:M28 family peptidase [Actinomycetes bacterium]
MTRTGASVLVLLLGLAACTSGGDAAGPEPTPSAVTPSAAPPTTAASIPEQPAEPPDPTAVAFDAAAAMRTVRDLAGIGPREATSPAFRAAADEVAARFAALGYDVRRDRFRVPAGESWGVPVSAGRTQNVVARSPGTPRGAAYVVVGAHLDTVPQSPGAEDNASGVAVLLELARLARAAPTRWPVTFVAFGAEEPRGPADDQHHFGSLRRAARVGDEPLRAMVSLDRVGAAGPVRVCTGGLSPRRAVRELLAAAERLDVRAGRCENRTSDHWPYEKAGETVARLGGNEYAAYHSARDLPRVVSRRQLDRVGRVVWEWLRAER